MKLKSSFGDTSRPTVNILMEYTVNILMEYKEAYHLGRKPSVMLGYIKGMWVTH